MVKPKGTMNGPNSTTNAGPRPRPMQTINRVVDDDDDDDGSGDDDVRRVS
jgi:hypothetical protein